MRPVWIDEAGEYAPNIMYETLKAPFFVFFYFYLLLIYLKQQNTVNVTVPKLLGSKWHFYHIILIRKFFLDYP